MDFQENKLNLSDQIAIGDPCYFPTSMYATLEVDIPEGVWDAYVEKSDEGTWGVRVAKMGITNHKRVWKSNQVGIAGVDSGQMMIIDFNSLELWEDNHDFPASGSIDEKYSGTLCYMGACEATLSGEQAGILADKAFVSSSGHGDGAYPVFVDRDADGQVCGVWVEFIGDEVDEDN